MHAMRRVYFLVAAASMRRRFIGFYGRCMRGIAVERQQDLAKAGTGRIRVDDRYGDPTLITGIGTRFTAEIKVGMKVALPKGVGEAKVTAVESDTQLRVAKEMKELAAIELLARAEGTSFKVVPHVDQDEMYHAVYQRLNNGECVGIFPEGGSHDRTEMLPLKAGATIMALGATAANPELGLKIVPTGLNYFHPSKFRSRAVIDFGQPIDVPPELVEKYRKGGEAKREACDELLRIVSEGLKQVTLNTPDYETLKMVQAGRRLYQPTQHSLTMAQQVELTRRFIKGYSVYRDLPEVKELRDRIEDYNLQLRYYGIRDHQVDTMRIGRAEAGMLFVWRLLWLLIMGLVALPGTVLNLPVFIVTGVVSKRKARAALAASTVKVRARDVVATWKILIALGLVPLLYTTYSVLAVLLVRRYQLADVAEWPSSRVYLWSWALAAFMSYTALVFGEQAVDIVKSVRPLFLTLILGEEHTELLARQREDLSDDITDLVNELGPKIYPEFAKTRVPADLLLGDGKKTHDNIINGSADAFHRKMREGEQALRQRIGGGSSSSSLQRVDSSEDSSEGLSTRQQQRSRRPSKYSFSPPTPRTMETLNSISPMEFLTSSSTSSTSAGRAEKTSSGGVPASVAARSSAAASSSNTDQQQFQGGTPATTGPSTPEPQNGMFDFS
ncbi:Glycerol-3-phosphate/dihydroxyacetone phosphate acyltransferase [Coemansia aciculifera]|uniref:Glycerol-3-phosphate/dihydroxyacetone phosphate acyltransferase n=1 Tax=Coemansia aciculifera TaxID=417176 RepID=A0ACC1M2X7_9FUNG|nr:Glycerol-3-phosphate/dihydroxyacetone phosphate acyltransferase [Coemansia aciculifera]